MRRENTKDSLTLRGKVEKEELQGTKGNPKGRRDLEVIK